MNSVTRYITAESLAARLITMRSGRKEVFLIVEGSEDMTLLSNVLEIPRSNFVSCGGKNYLDDLFDLIPHRGLDSGTVFIRDRDFDGMHHEVRGDTLRLVTDLYDFEIQLLSGRLFKRVLSEYLTNRSDAFDYDNAFRTIMGAAALIGALRAYAHDHELPLDFDNLRYDFIDVKSMQLDVVEMTRKVEARSRVSLGDRVQLSKYIVTVVETSSSLEKWVCGKNALDILHIALSRYYRCCSSSECEPIVLAHILRIAASVEDLKHMSMWSKLVEWVNTIQFSWPGIPLTFLENVPAVM